MTFEEFDIKTWFKWALYKLLTLITSRKFWALVFALLAIWQQFGTGTITAETAVWSTVTAIATYSGLQVADDYLTKKVDS